MGVTSIPPSKRGPLASPCRWEPLVASKIISIPPHSPPVARANRKDAPAGKDGANSIAGEFRFAPPFDDMIDRYASPVKHFPDSQLNGRRLGGQKVIALRPPMRTLSHMLAIEHVRIDDLQPNPANPRQNDDAVDAVARSIQAYGFNSSIITDADLNVAAGHTRLKAARKLGLETVPVIRVPGLTGSKFAGYAIADNRTAELAEWDQELLSRLVSELNLDTEFNLTDLGFSDRELTELLDLNFQDPESREDEAPPLPDAPVTQRGDLYLLGDHRLLCGDATNAEDMHTLLDGGRLSAILTDPPYGVSYLSRGQKREEWGGIQNDNLDVDDLERFLHASFTNLAAACRPGAVAYVCHGISMAGIRIAFERAFVQAGFHLSSTIVWAKQSASMGWSDYREQHECLLYGWIGEGHRKIKDRTQTTLWRIDREGNYRHPTQKPVALLSRALRNSTIRGERVCDPFSGSGTTLIACEQLGRRCYAMEIEPKYCDVAVQRWEAYTGKAAELQRRGDLADHARAPQV